MENLPDELVQLIDRFKEHQEQYKGVSYDEANTRTDFIDPLFALLGWDVANQDTCVCTRREKSGLQVQIAALDRAIDSLVFRLYDLRNAEISAITTAMQ